MENINELTTEQIQELLDLSKRLKEQEIRDESIDLQVLLEEIFDDLETTSKTVLRNKLKKSAKDTYKYDGGKWTQSGTVNKVYLPELKKYQVDAAQTTTAITKGADRLRTAGRATTEIYQEFQHLIEIGGTEDDMRNILERIRRLAVYQFGTGKELDKDAKDTKDLTTKALRLPESLKYLEDDDDEGKDYFFSSEVIEKTQQTRFEESVINQASQRKYGGFGKNKFTRGGRQPNGNRGSFFGRGRSRDWQRSHTTPSHVSQIDRQQSQPSN
ncbi:uncharacterized protein RHIMIDRAFT_313120 [Rhizopus microsporus ATCC 52813]|uniref:Uncharacterized protein n=1 Tax=Rhizopus microsporus ATCC 52813 TaxID=1340429 RepID=A0A2G4SWN4_RHIZD|nr:uncharacterized protein RHIMIDRAFT_313120 [Rhizopus microsporus ATCC 52813]PHZ13152.1 hypothetical protein RHIMIDRAFT_313120 [Rhizopus microsporus ATCC 52813]